MSNERPTQELPMMDEEQDYTGENGYCASTTTVSLPNQEGDQNEANTARQT